MNTTSKADIKRAEDAVNQTLMAAYAPMEVGGEQLCWEGRIDRAIERSGDLVQSGKLTQEQVRGIIDGFVAEYKSATSASMKAENEYCDLCKAAGIAPKHFQRPHCPCTSCAKRIRYRAATDLENALAEMLKDCTSDAIANVVTAWKQCKQLGVTMEIDFFLSKIDF